VSFEIPALGFCQHLNFALKASAVSRPESLLDRLASSVVEIACDLDDDLQAVDWDGMQETMDRWRSKAMDQLAEWDEKLKNAQEGLIKVDLAKKQMNSMREAYYKELTQLRQQLQLKEEADRTGKTYEACDFSLFDPTQFAFDDESGALLRQRAAEMDRLFNAAAEKWKLDVENMKYKLQTANMLANRRERLLNGLMDRHGYKSEQAMEQAVHASWDAAMPDEDGGQVLALGSATSEGKRMVSLLSGEMQEGLKNKARSMKAMLKRGASTVGATLRGITPGYRRTGSTASLSMMARASSQMSLQEANARSHRSAVAETQTDLVGQDVQEAITQLFESKRRESERVGTAKGAADGQRPRTGKARPWAKAVEERLSVSHIGIQCSADDMPDIVDLASSAYQEDDIDERRVTADSFSSVVLRTPTEGSASEAVQRITLSAVGGVGDILRRHGVPAITTMMESDEDSPPGSGRKTSLLQPGAPISPAGRSRRIGVQKGSVARRSSCDSMTLTPSNPLGPFSPVSPTAVQSAASSPTLPAIKRSSRRTAAVTPEVVSAIDDAAKRTGSRRSSDSGSTRVSTT